MTENVARFIAEVQAAVERGTFVRLTLGSYKGTDERLQKLVIRPVTTKRGDRLFFLYKHTDRDIAKNFSRDESLEIIRRALQGEFYSGHLFTTEKDVQLDIGKKGRSRLHTGKPTFTTVPSTAHDRHKKLKISPDNFYLRALGVSDETGRVRDKQQDKWRQINKYVEVLASLFEKSELKDRSELTIVDMGSGKGYLTFAAYDYFANVRGLKVSITGVETKGDLVEMCNSIAGATGFDGLTFVQADIATFDPGQVDILIALHACDTATDDALFKGIASRASLIVAAPCCHKELRRQIQVPPMFRDILRHGVMLERTAETLTDGLRSLILERSGYETKLFEFVSTEHTPKNNMLVATRRPRTHAQQRADEQIHQICEAYGIKEQSLLRQLELGGEKVDRRPAAA
jgi:hypothetical protein